jgi:hypothetical protein
MTNLIRMKNPYLQRKFSESTKKRLASVFDFSLSEDLLCGIWCSSVFRHGFVITNKALYWHFKTTDGLKTGKIIKDSASNITFEISPHISSENSVASLAKSIAEECSKLEIRTGERSETFYITGLTEEKGKTLCDILKFAFTQNALPQIDLGKLVKKAAFSPLTTFLDMILNLIKHRWMKTPRRISKPLSLVEKRWIFWWTMRWKPNRKQKANRQRKPTTLKKRILKLNDSFYQRKRGEIA